MSLTLATPRLLLSYEPDVDTFDWAGGGRCGVYYLWHESSCAGAISIVSLAKGTGEIGYEMEPEYRGQGLASEGVIAVVEAAVRLHGFTMLAAQAHADNAASHRVLEKAGFVAVASKLRWVEDRALPMAVVQYRRAAAAVEVAP